MSMLWLIISPRRTTGWSILSVRLVSSQPFLTLPACPTINQSFIQCMHACMHLISCTEPFRRSRRLLRLRLARPRGPPRRPSRHHEQSSVESYHASGATDTLGRSRQVGAALSLQISWIFLNSVSYLAPSLALLLTASFSTHTQRTTFLLLLLAH